MPLVTTAVKPSPAGGTSVNNAEEIHFFACRWRHLKVCIINLLLLLLFLPVGGAGWTETAGMKLIVLRFAIDVVIGLGLVLGKLFLGHMGTHTKDRRENEGKRLT